MFQSSFELTGYITTGYNIILRISEYEVSKLFRAYGLYNIAMDCDYEYIGNVSKLFRAYGLYNSLKIMLFVYLKISFKALSSLRVI